MCVIIDYFATIGTGWVNLISILGAFAGICVSIFAIYISNKLSEEGAEVAGAIHRQTRILRIDNLRHLYEISKDSDSHVYWNFRWRFETFDFLLIEVLQYGVEDPSVLGFCKLSIKGFSCKSDHIGFENRPSRKI